MDIAAFLKDVEIFESLSQTSAERLAKEVTSQYYAAGTHIVRRGEAGDRMFVIVAGEVQVPVLDSEGKRRYTARLGPKQIFGEMALLTGDPRNADVLAVTDCHVLEIRKDTVERLIRQNPEIARFLSVILWERVMRSGSTRRIGKYHLLGEIGRGGMAVVYEGLHPTLERSVAIKMLSHELAYHPMFRDRFRAEAKMIAKLRHPHIVEIFDTEEAYATFFIVMEKLKGMDLDRIIANRGRIPPVEVIDIVKQVAGALHVAHQQGIIHRDVKPSNIILDAEGEVKLTDFGLALTPQTAELDRQQADACWGTPYYMAPEQIRNDNVDVRIDIYALGVVAYEMLSGAPPFQGDVYEVLNQHLYNPMPRIREAFPDVPEQLEIFIARATAKDPKQRFKNCSEILDFFSSNLAAQAPRVQDLRVRSLTFVFPPEQQDNVDKFLKKILVETQTLPNTLVKAS